MAIPFVDLQGQYQECRELIDRHIREVLDSSRYILGEKGEQLERELARFVGRRHAIGVGSGTDALQLALMAAGVGPGDEVITTPFSFIATAEVITLVGAAPVFVDIEADTYNIDPDSIEEKITDRTRAVLPVDLFGQCADYPRINRITERCGLAVIEDAAQSFGAEQNSRRACALAQIGCTSFYPAKPLGCYGEGGMVFTDSDELAEAIRSLRVHGEGRSRFEHVRIGMNARLDEIQAAVLLGKLPAFPREIEQRQKVARRYDEALRGLVVTPTVRPGNLCSWAQYSIRVPDRDALRASLQEAGVPTAVFYPVPLHLQGAFERLGYGEGDLPVAEEVCRSIVSLPMHPYLDAETQDFIVSQLRAAVKSSGGS